MGEADTEPSTAIHSPNARRGSQSGSEADSQSEHHDRAIGELSVVDQDSEDSPPLKKKSTSFNIAFVGLAIAVFVFQLDATTLGVALPDIAAELNGTSLESFWANISYTLCVVITQPQWTSISNAFGRKPCLYASMFLFAVGSLVFALAQNMSTIIAGRVLQGLGGGGLDVLAEIILADMTTLQERSFYLGLMAIPISIGNILGPTIGALWTTYVSWRWIGWINLPLLGVSTPLIIFFLRLRTIPLDASLLGNLKRLDWIGMALSITGICVFVLPLSWAGSLYSWDSWRTLLPLVLGVIILVAFAVYEKYPAAPIVPHRLFRSKTANMTLVGAFLHGMVLFTVLQYLPLLYQSIELQTVIGSAVSLLPTSIVSVVVAAASMMLIAVFGGGYCWVIRFSWVIMTVGTGLLALFTLTSDSSMRYGLPILWGVGVALLRLLLLPIQASVQNVDDTGLAIGMLLTIRLFGGLVGLAIASTIFSTTFSDSVSSIQQSLVGPLAPLRDSNNAIAFIPELRQQDIPNETLDSILRIYLQSFRVIFYTLTAMAGLGFITSIFTDELDLKKTDRGRQQFED